MIVIHLGFHKGENLKKDDVKKKSKDDPKDKKKEARKDSEIGFSPHLFKVEKFFRKALKMIIESVNKVFNLEDDLMPFLQKDKTPNFLLSSQFEWI